MQRLKRMLIPLLIVLVFAIVFVFVIVPNFVIPAISPRPNNLGVTNGRLADCPGTPNCVSTQQDTAAAPAMTPLTYTGTLAEAKTKLIAVINAMPGSTIIDAAQSDYIYTEFRTSTMHFIDDTEFYFDDTAKVIHFRSASRLGGGDMGVNKQRMEEISRRFAQAG